VIIRLSAAGEGISLLPPAILTTELRLGALQILKTKPEIVRPRLYAAYQVEKAGPGIGAVLETARNVIARSGLITVA
jgi:DNA-binding transcriptional LysR family regulator